VCVCVCVSFNLKEIKLQPKLLKPEVKVTQTSLKRNLPETQKSLQQVSTLKSLKLIGPKIIQIINFNL